MLRFGKTWGFLPIFGGCAEFARNLQHIAGADRRTPRTHQGPGRVVRRIGGQCARVLGTAWAATAAGGGVSAGSSHSIGSGRRTSASAIT